MCNRAVNPEKNLYCTAKQTQATGSCSSSRRIVRTKQNLRRDGVEVCYGKGSRDVRQVVLLMSADSTSRSPEPLRCTIPTERSLQRFGSGRIRTTSILTLDF